MSAVTQSDTMIMEYAGYVGYLLVPNNERGRRLTELWRWQCQKENRPCLVITRKWHYASLCLEMSTTTQALTPEATEQARQMLVSRTEQGGVVMCSQDMLFTDKVRREEVEGLARELLALACGWPEARAGRGWMNGARE